MEKIIKWVWSWWWRKYNLFLLGCFPAYLLDKVLALRIDWITGKGICQIVCSERGWCKKIPQTRQGRKWWSFPLAGSWNCTGTSCSAFCIHFCLLLPSWAPIFALLIRASLISHLGHPFSPKFCFHAWAAATGSEVSVCCWGLAQLADFLVFEEFHEQTPSFPLYLTRTSSLQGCGRESNPSQEERKWHENLWGKWSVLCAEEPGEIWRSGEGKSAGMSRSL